MIASDPYRREYRYAGGGWLWFVLAALFLGGVGVVEMALDDWVPITVPLAVGAALAALFWFVVRLVKVTATISDATQLTVRGPFCTRATAWPDVQGIEIEVSPGARGGRGAEPDSRAVRRVEDWAPVPAAAEKIARMRRHPTPLAHIAFKTMLGAGMVGAVLFLVALASGIYDGVDTNPFAGTIVHPWPCSWCCPSWRSSAPSWSGRSTSVAEKGRRPVEVRSRPVGMADQTARRAEQGGHPSRRGGSCGWTASRAGRGHSRSTYRPESRSRPSRARRWW